VEEVGGLVPVDPHATEVITEQVVKGISGQKAETVRDPICLARGVVVVRLGPLAEFTDRLCALFVGARPDSQSNAIESVRRILLEDESVMNAMRLAGTGADFDIMRETGPHGRMKRTGNFMILLQARTATQDFRQPELTDGTLHVSNLALTGCGSLDPLRRLPSDTTHHVGMGEGLWRTLTISRLCQLLRRQRLRDTRVKRRCPGWDGHITLSSTDWSRGARVSTARSRRERLRHL